ncbi:hypothetical protein Ciccas_003201 [Cichlidogyrus casuarinus]|uniref:ATPase ASNA1 homolog n=1 Tax=Cichlidogyrus casuarinus TaxID=1844966 RepID=A0ABD2QF15_9PLAT
MEPAPNINNLLEHTSLRWIFVGGKGGVGKTTCSCSIAVQLAKVRENVLIISTDPAHNLSDAFDQKFSKIPTPVSGFTNLFAMEIDPTINLNEFEEDLLGSEEAAMSAELRKNIRKVMSSLPGVDEYMSYTEVFNLVKNLNYSCVVFDTAPTGHTLRLLAFPEMMEQSLSKIVQFKSRLGPFLGQIAQMIGLGDVASDEVTSALESKLEIVKQITQQFKDPDQTTFVCVCIPEFLSLYETERLIQELGSQSIDVQNIIVNQLLFPCKSDELTENISTCRMCLARHKIQSKYMVQYLDLYDDKHVIQLPLLENEIRGPEAVKSFSERLIKGPYL